MVSYDRVSEHPVRWALTAAAVIFAWVLFLSATLVTAIAAGLGMFIVSWGLWRPRGPGHRLRRWMLRRFPPR